MTHEETNKASAQSADDTAGNPSGKSAQADRAPEQIPAELDVDASRYRQSLRDQLQPATALELILVDEMARHAASMEISAGAEGRVLRFAARHAEYLHRAPADLERQAEAMIAASMTNHATERVERYGQVHRRAFYRALSQLQFLRSEKPIGGDDRLPSAFESEEACEAYLLGRAQAARSPCPRCRKRKRHYLRARRCWECSSCGMQSGIRRGTVMESSPLPLNVWFKVILAVSREPSMAVRDLADRVGLTRVATVRNMAKKVQAAIDSPDAETRLAGLHRLSDVGLAGRSTYLQRARASGKYSNSGLGGKIRG